MMKHHPAEDDPHRLKKDRLSPQQENGLKTAAV
jgi:hypothetical protein